MELFAKKNDFDLLTVYLTSSDVDLGSSFWVTLLTTDKQTDRETDRGKNITSLVE